MGALSLSPRDSEQSYEDSLISDSRNHRRLGPSLLLLGNRPKSDVLRGMIELFAPLVKEYEIRYVKKHISGGISVILSINTVGAVLDCAIASSTMHDQEFETTVMETVKKARFSPSSRVSDVTVVEYFFIFSPELIPADR